MTKGSRSQSSLVFRATSFYAAMRTGVFAFSVCNAFDRVRYLPDTQYRFPTPTSKPCHPQKIKEHKDYTLRSPVPQVSVGTGGLEPPCQKTLDPKSRASTNSVTLPFIILHTRIAVHLRQRTRRRQLHQSRPIRQIALHPEWLWRTQPPTHQRFRLKSLGRLLSLSL